MTVAAFTGEARRPRLPEHRLQERYAIFLCARPVDGELILESGHFPKLIGLLMKLAGVSYLVGCFAALFAPAFSALISPAVLVPALIGESSFCLWLLVKGVDIGKWNAAQQAIGKV